MLVDLLYPYLYIFMFKCIYVDLFPLLVSPMYILKFSVFISIAYLDCFPLHSQAKCLHVYWFHRLVSSMLLSLVLPCLLVSFLFSSLISACQLFSSIGFPYIYSQVQCLRSRLNMTFSSPMNGASKHRDSTKARALDITRWPRK